MNPTPLMPFDGKARILVPAPGSDHSPGTRISPPNGIYVYLPEQKAYTLDG